MTPAVLHRFACAGATHAVRTACIVIAWACAGSLAVPALAATNAIAAQASLSGASAHTATDTLRLVPAGPLVSGERQSRTLAWSPDGKRFARLLPDRIELWQQSPQQRIAAITEALPGPPATAGPGNAASFYQLLFGPDGRLHYLANGVHGWLDADLRRGSGPPVEQISSDGRHAVSTLRSQGDAAPAQHVIDLATGKTVCPLPGVQLDGAVASFGAGWFAARLPSTGPQDPAKPLAVCDLTRGKTLLVPLAGVSFRAPVVDSQGRWMLAGGWALDLSGGRVARSFVFTLPLDADQTGQGSASASSPGSDLCKTFACGLPTARELKTPMPLEPRVSPDGRWLVEPAAQGGIALFRSPSMQHVALLQSPAGERMPPASRLAFSPNGQWLAVQAGQHLYRVDLRQPSPALVPVAIDARIANLHSIGDDGRQWLLSVVKHAEPTLWQEGVWHIAP